MSRGVDIPCIDWVIHFDLPNTLEHYIHRSGRSGHQVGQKGNSLLLLLEHELAFVELCVEKGICLKPQVMESINESEESRQDDIIAWIKNEARKNASYYELGMKAFVSFIRNYSASNVMSQTLFQKLDVVELSNSYGLLKIPKMPELKGKVRTSATTFNKCDGDQEIAEQHQNVLYQEKSSKVDSAAKVDRQQIKQKLKVKRQRMKKKINSTKLQGKRKRELIDDLEFKELAEDARMVKKLKKGKISNRQFEEHFGV
jgi:ATP-dependent RNA helicase DDX55/SPB4